MTFTIGMQLPVEELITLAVDAENRAGRKVSRNSFIVRAAERDARRVLRRPRDRGHAGERFAKTG